MSFVGCACHLMHLAASKAAKCVPVNVEDPLIDIYYYLEKSSKRKQSFKEMQIKYEVPMKKILKHVSTRWLSLGKCLERLIEQYPALIAFFEAEVAKERKSSAVPEKNKACTSKKRTLSEKHADPEPCKIPKLVDNPMPAVSKSSSSKSIPAVSTSSSAKAKDFDLSSYLFKDKKTKETNQMPHNHGKSAKKEKESKAKKILCDLKNVNTRLYWHFISNVIPIFEKAKAFLQNEEPCIHKVHKVLCDQFSNLLVRFIKPKCIKKCSSIYDIDFSSKENQKSDEELYIGPSAKCYLSEHSECDRKVFYSNVRNFYTTACQYMLKMFPYGDSVLINAEFLDISKRCSVTFSQIEFFWDRYSIIQTQTKRDELEEEFLQYQIEDLPTSITESDRIDVAWHLISQIIDPATRETKFKNLCKVAKCVLVIFHSNSDCERLFSIVNKTKLSLGHVFLQKL